MQLDLGHFPQTLDLLHLILAAVALLAVLAAVFGRGKAAAAPAAIASAPQSAPVAPVAPVLKAAGPDSALQLLALLQQEARLIDFLSEDVKGFSDAEVGAAARVVHEGGKKVINEYFTLQPVRSENEESRVTLPEGFDAASVRLTGNVVGQAPFTGTLIHRGWQVKEVRLPRVAEGRNLHIVAPAEVEL